jgi:ATP dependent DNA ligase domain
VRLYSRPGNDMTRRFPLITEALTGLRSRSCIIDGEAVACDDNGLASFERIRYRQHDGAVFLYAFDLIELNGDDLRRDPLQVRKATLASILAKARHGNRFNEHIEGDARHRGDLLHRAAAGRALPVPLNGWTRRNALRRARLRQRGAGRRCRHLREQSAGTSTVIDGGNGRLKPRRNLLRVKCLLRQRPSRTPDRGYGGKEAMHETDLVRCCCRAALLDLLAG